VGIIAPPNPHEKIKEVCAEKLDIIPFQQMEGY
jgi:hypothetical protein